jgi:hypothetical protein
MRTPALFLLSFLVACNGDKPTDDTSAPLNDTGDDPVETGTEDDTGTPVLPTDIDGDGYTDDEDCDDANPAIYPGADEYCNDVDNDCDGVLDNDPVDPRTWYIDADGDGFGDSADGLASCDPMEDRVSTSGDCDDADDRVHPDALETCNGVDDNCDGDADGVGSVDATTWYADTDADGYGDPNAPSGGCEAPSGTVANASDCDDTDAAVHPGVLEDCDGVDNNCDGNVDEGEATSGSTFYADVDGDGFGDAASTRTACSLPSGYTTSSNDCDDTNASAHPGASEYCNGADDDCDSVVDENDAIDVATWYADTDGDGHGDINAPTLSCSQPSNTSSVPTDCDDADPAAYLGNAEVCDDTDNNCDGSTDEGVTTTYYADADGDAYGDSSQSVEACAQPTGHTGNGDDCDDAAFAVNPGETETCNGVDDNCDGSTDEGVLTTFYADADGDSYGDASSPTDDCALPTGYSSTDDDCDDALFDVNPGVTEACDSIDNNCDGSIDEGLLITFYLDSDADTWGDSANALEACTLPSGYSTAGGDCNDTDATLNLDDVDTDGDTTCDGDCDDDDATLNLDDIDADGTSSCDGDCDDDDATLNVDDVDTDGTSTCEGDCDDSATSVGICWAGVTTGVEFTCGLTSAGNVICWGENGFGQATPPPNTLFTSVSAGSRFTCGVTTSGSIECWGYNNSGESTPLPGTFEAVDSGDEYACGLTTSGSAECWGRDDAGQSTPPPNSTYVSVNVGRYFTWGLTGAGVPEIWGGFSYDDNTAPTGVLFQSINTNYRHTCGITSTNEVECWGIQDGTSEDYGQVTNTPLAGTFQSVSVGHFHSCALTTSGAAECWGSDGDGRSTPPAGNFQSISAGYEHTCGLTTSNTIECWGGNAQGQSTPPAL